MPWTIEDEIRRAEAEDARAAWWEEYTESVNDAWGGLTTLPIVITIMGNPVRLDSTGMPPWLTAATEPPDALQTTNDDGQPTTAADPSTTLITSLSTKPASGTGQTARIITVVSTFVTYPSTTPPPTDTSTSSRTKTIIGVAALAGTALLVMLLIGGYMLGRRTPTTSEKSGNRTPWLLWPARKDGEYVESEDQKCLAPFAEDVHELPGGGVVHEMPTEVNIQEMAEVTEPVELPTREPVVRDDEMTENSPRQGVFETI